MQCQKSQRQFRKALPLSRQCVARERWGVGSSLLEPSAEPHNPMCTVWFLTPPKRSAQSIVMPTDNSFGFLLLVPPAIAAPVCAFIAPATVISFAMSVHNLPRWHQSSRGHDYNNIQINEKAHLGDVYSVSQLIIAAEY